MYNFGNQAPWTQAALQSILGAQNPQQAQGQGMQTQPAEAQVLANPITDMQSDTSQQNMTNQGGMGQGQQGQMQQAPLMQPQQVQNDPLMSSDSFLNGDQKAFKQWSQFWGGGGEGGSGGGMMNGLGSMMMFI